MHNLSKYISIALHPVLIPTLATFLYFIVAPTYFHTNQIYIILGLVFLGSYILPLSLLVLFKKINIISSFEIKETYERRIPILSFLLISFLIGKMLYSLPDYQLLSLMFIGGFIALSITYLLLFLNFKTSLHVLGASGFTAFMILISYAYNINLIGLIAFLFFLTGFLGTARLILKAHKPKELIAGFIIGISSILISTLFLNYI
ncbi:MAG: hypothetical protein L3J45_05220 [Flavobacteriaceae bacterium]|nr:hypothetical protein [Flavobacteriaceae bacterium]